MVLSNIPPPLAPTNDASTDADTANTTEFHLPAYSSWFSFDKIDDIERRALSEFFPSENASTASSVAPLSKFKTPETYCEYRDFMIRTFRMRPREYLTVTTCRRHLAGDVAAIMRIHAFLEQWGLINYQIVEGGDVSSGFSYAAGMAAAAGEAQRRALPSTLDAFLKAEAPIITCHRCNVDCTASYFHHPSRKISLCPSCFSSGEYSSDMASGEFVKIDPSSFSASSATPASSLADTWSDEEVLKLMEAVEKYAESGVNLAANNVWDAIAESVGRSREACLLQFLRIPASEYLSSLSRTGASAPANVSDPSSFLAFPFSQSDNPVLSVLAFLASNVHPRVAAVASQAALSELAKVTTSQSAADGTASSGENEAILKDSTAMQHVASTALACAAAHAQELARTEEQRIAFWRDVLIETYLKKLQLRLDSLEELERVVEEERKEIEKQRLQIFMERFSMRKMLLQAEQRAAASSNT